MIRAADLRAVLLLLAVAEAIRVYRSKSTLEPDDIASAAHLLERLPASPSKPPAGFDVNAMVGWPSAGCTNVGPIIGTT